MSGAAVAGSQAVGQPHQQPLGGHEQVLRHPAVEAEPASAAHDRCLGRVIAIVLEALLAPGALAATPGAVDDGVALRDRGDTVADRVDPTGVPVTERERHLPRHHAWLEVVHHVQVGVTRPRASDLDENLARTRCRLRHLHQLRIGLPINCRAFIAHIPRLVVAQAARRARDITMC